MKIDTKNSVKSCFFGPTLFEKTSIPHIEKIKGAADTQILIVDAKRLSGQGTTILRFFKNIDAIEDERESLIEALKQEKTLGKMSVDHFMEFVMEAAKEFKLNDLLNISASELRKRSETIGIEKGRREGLIKLAKRLFGKIDHELSVFTNNDALEEEIFRRVQSLT